MVASPVVLPELEVVDDLRRVSALLHPLRLRILHQAAQPASATQIAGRLRLPRQRVNYHFRQLIRARFLHAAGRNRKRNMFEKLYLASAAGYLIAPQVLGPARADWRSISDAQSPGYLQALLANVQADLASARSRTETISVKTQFRLRNPGEREDFVRALREALEAIVTRHTGPASRESGDAAEGGLHRLVVACYPYFPAAVPE